MKTYFDHERLNVYQEAIAFCGWVGDLLNQIAAKAAVKDQLDRASTSIPLNIAEGNGKFSNADRARFFEIARGSALECAACLDVLLARKLVSQVGRVDYARVRILENQVDPLAISGASILSSTTIADGFVIVPADSEGFPPGADVDVFLYD